MTSLVRIHGTDIQIKEHQGQRVVTFRDIDEVHQRPNGTAARNFSTNRERFIKGIDFFKLTAEEMRYTNFVERPNPQGLVLITESGYLMLAKSLTDDLAWAVQRELVNAYFRAKPQITSVEDLIIMQAQSVKELKAKVAQVEERAVAAHHRIDNLDAIDTIGDLQQRLNAMVRKYAHKNGLAFSKAWSDFREAFNIAYRTNLKLLIANYKIKHGIKRLTMPGYLTAVGRLEDGIRVADKLLNIGDAKQVAQG